MKKNNRPTQPLVITRLSHDGRGIASENGKTVFVANALPGETVTVQYLRTHKKFNEAIALEILTASPDRVSPQCQHFGVCGGCQLQHMSPATQLDYKQKMLLELFTHIAQTTPKEMLPPLHINQYAYRSKARLGAKFVEKKQQMLVGFREVNGRYLADIKSCAVLAPMIGQQLTALSQCIQQLSGYKTIPQVEVAMTNDSDCLLIFRHLEPLTETDINSLIHFGKTHNFIICLQPGNYDTVHQIYPVSCEPPQLHYTIPAYDLTLEFHPSDFTQVNYPVNLAMIDRALQLLAPQSHEKILDLFCGLGNFTLPIAKYAATVTGIEGDSNMVRKAQHNAQRNQLNHITFYSANLFDSNITHPWYHAQYDKILIDPPRAGAEEICKNINRFNAGTIVYISCNPATLARDTLCLTKQGYTLAKAGIIDMFPQTAHVETIALFTKT